MPVISVSPGQPFSLDQTLGCGQVFRWERMPDGTWQGIVGNHVIRIRQEGHNLRFMGAPVEFIRLYFSLDVDLPPLLTSIDNDPVIHRALKQCCGLRLVRQPAWECTVSYICSTNSNIPTIQRRIGLLAEQFGTRVRSGRQTFYTFPEPSRISCKGHESLTACRLGYRQPFVYSTSCAIPDVNSWEKTIRELPYEAARKELMKLQGVGPKAADCILLFAFQKYEAFPVDVWIRRILQEHYLPELATGAPLTTREYNQIRTFAREHFGDKCGWAQEYLYAARLK
jgi:N-glycosylase/DNA lyase